MKRWCKMNQEGEIESVFVEPLIVDDTAVYNPTAAQLTAQAYIYIDIPEQPQTEPTQEERLQAVETLLDVQGQAEQLPDEEAINVKALFPAWADHIGETMMVGKRYYYDGELWKVLQQHTAQADWNPRDAHSLFVRVTVEEWPEWTQPTGATDAYSQGDKVSHNSQHWISLVDGNVWEPSEAVATLWELKQ